MEVAAQLFKMPIIKAELIIKIKYMRLKEKYLPKSIKEDKKENEDGWMDQGTLREWPTNDTRVAETMLSAILRRT